jgi:DNA mismatch repair protein MutS2
MDQHALQVLEFDKVKNLVRHFACSTLGKEAIDALQPFTHIEGARYALKETSEMVRLYTAKQVPPLNGIYDIRPIVKKSVIPGAVLDTAEIVLVGETITAAARIQSSLSRCEVDVPLLKKYGARLSYHADLEKAINHVFDAQKNIRDDASKDLFRLRQAIRQQRTSIIRRLESLIRGGWKEYVQETFYTNRSDRYVIPVDAKYQNRVKGIIHDRSSTGTTVYIEPIELVEDGNHLKNLHRDEEMEIRKILQELTVKIAAKADEFFQNLDVFQMFDFLSAKARYSLQYRMEEPELSVDGYLKLSKGRHPLLLEKHGKENVVPLSMELDTTTHGLLISGPNTGGKTVVIKTLGLLVLMAQSGLHIPASGQSQLPVYTYIGADIGDEQSLEQSLSTFSSHMMNICSILENADEHALVLIDELGSGTDPVEGGALSCAIIEQLYKQKATFVITTHLQELKMFAYQNEGIENGSMEFDMSSLQPTFLFRMGLPGQSNAIQIANRLGLPPEIIQAAQARVKQGGDSPEDMLTRIGAELRSAESLRKKAQDQYSKAKQQFNENKQYQKKAEAKAQDIIQRAERKSQQLVSEMERRVKEMEKREQHFLQEWKTRLDFLVQQVAQNATASAPTIAPAQASTFADIKKDIQQTKKQLKQQRVPSRPKDVSPPRKVKPWNPHRFTPGTRVKLDTLTDTAVITKVWEHKRELEVNASSMVVKVKFDNVVEILGDRPPKKIKYEASIKVERPEFMHNTCDVHGLTVEEMTPIVEKYLDDAFLHGQPYVYIVHGHGKGILRNAVHNMLRKHPIVKSYKLGDEYEGGTGVTVASLNSSILKG